ncbi:MAG TPA: helix-turn-helix domain-containing protein [Mucilaginibacter sp.]|nr:helix-turn-helix domain-containing protein [Mucilaginibacter sp.]
MEPFNFNELPEVVRLLFEKVEQIALSLERLEPKDDKESDLLNIEEAAEFLKVSVAALYTKVSRKEIPFSKPGKRLYFNKSDLKEWIRLGSRKTITDIEQLADQFPYRNRFRSALRKGVKV